MKRLSALLLALAIFASLCACAIAEAPPAQPDKENIPEDNFVTADYSAWNFIKKIPMKPKYTEEVEEKGTVEMVTYTCPYYAMIEETGDESITVEKQMMVYTPYGYDASKEYDVLYLMHGGGEDEYYWLSETRMGKPTVALLDREIAKGECKPVIVVAPTNNYTYEGETKGDSTGFSREVREVIVPYIESHYATFAHGDVSPENLTATRNHRAFAGFSMGSMISINIMMTSLDYFGYIGSYSAGTSNYEGFQAALTSEEFKDLPIYFWYNGEGTADFALGSHIGLRDFALSEMSDRFVDGENYCWVIFKGGTHAYNCWLPHTYNALRVFFND